MAIAIAPPTAPDRYAVVMRIARKMGSTASRVGTGAADSDC